MRILGLWAAVVILALVVLGLGWIFYKELTASNAALASHKDKVADLEQANAQLGQDYSHVQADFEAAQEAIDIWQEALAQEQSSLAATREELGQTEAELATSEGALATTESELAETEDTLATTQEELKSEKAAVATVAHELRSLQALVGSKDQLESDLETLEADVARVQEQIARVREEIRELVAQRAIIPKPYKDEVACTGSMEPAITCLDRITFRKVGDLDLEVGNVVTFEDGDDLILHRIIAIAESPTETYYLTKGDNNLLDDGLWLRRSELVEVVVGIEKGALANSFRTELRDKVNKLYKGYKDALTPCTEAIHAGGSCVVSNAAKYTIEGFEERVDYVICAAYNPNASWYCGLPFFYPVSEWQWRYTFEPSIQCTPPSGAQVEQVWRANLLQC